MKTTLENNYRIRRCLVPPLYLIPCEFGKIRSRQFHLTKLYIEHFNIKNYFKIILLNFLFIWYDTAIISYFSKHFPHLLAFVIFNEVNLSNIFLVFFFYIWSFKVDSIFIIIRFCFCSVSSILIGSFSPFSFSSELLL